MKFKRYFDRSKRQNSIYRPPSIVADLYFTQQSARIQLIIYLIFTFHTDLLLHITCLSDE